MVKLLHHGPDAPPKPGVPARPYQPYPGVGIGTRALIDWQQSRPQPDP